MHECLPVGGDDRDHLAQLSALTRRLVWPWMGNARRFSLPDA